jgi:ribosome-binding factor A
LGTELARCGDPRLGHVTVTAVDVANDLKTAWVYWAVHPDQLSEIESDSRPEPREASPEVIQDASSALDGAAKLLRRRMGEQLSLRHVPVLRFKHDESLARGMHIDHLLSKL